MGAEICIVTGIAIHVALIIYFRIAMKTKVVDCRVNYSNSALDYPGASNDKEQLIIIRMEQYWICARNHGSNKSLYTVSSLFLHEHDIKCTTSKLIH